MNMLSLPLVVLCLAHEILADQSSYSAIPRWGQAAALVEQTLYIHGGRTDPYNSYSYSAAPPNNDLLALSLASSFNPSSPSFDYVGGCSNCSSSSGPAVAWHTLTPFNATGLLLFGGDPGPNSQTVLPDRNDSSVLLSTSSPLDPVWDFETESWASEPMRRIYHSAVSAQGKVWIVGGEKADDSGSAFSQHYVFDPSGPSFSTLPTSNAPPDITGHQSVVLSDGRMLVFGGYSPSQQSLIPFTTVWSMNTTEGDSLSWSTLSISTSSVPSPRRNFAATPLDNGKVLIQGGADSTLQNSLSDGWILDTTQSPMVWSNVTALTQLGPRRDHFAVGVGSIAIIGFGYAQNGPAAASLEVFDASSGSFLTSYTPPAAISTPTATTLPASTQTGTTETTGHPGSAEYPQPTPSKGGGGGGGDPNGGGNGNGNGQGGDPSSADTNSKNHTTAIILGTVFGVLALLLGAAAATYYVRRRNSRESFHLLSESGDEESPHGEGPIPIAGAGGSREKGLPLIPVVYTIRDRLSRVVPGLAPGGDPQERRDMLAEEDTREFETNGWYNIARHPSSGQSSWNSRRRPTLERVYDSLASLRSVGGAMLEYAAGAAAAGARSLKSREPSAASNTNTLDAAIWDEKRSPFDPYTDEFGASTYSPPVVGASRPRGGRQASSATYTDPFADYFEVESLKYDSDMVYRDDDDDDVKGYPFLHDPPPPPRLASLRPPATLDLTRLTPVSEGSSIPTLSDPASSSETSLAASVPRSPAVAPGGASSSSSHDPPHSPRRPSSILDANSSSSQFLKRSNTWWARFAKTPLLDRRTPSIRSQRPLEFRDPNPPPRLVTITESTDSQQSPDSPEGKRRSVSGGHAQRFSTHHHGRSASSLQTSRTANSEQLERMANTMQIVQKDGSTSSSNRSFLSREGSGGDTSAEMGHVLHHREATSEGADTSSAILDSPSQTSSEAFVLSPTDMTREESTASILPGLPPPARPPPPSRSSSSLVSERIQAYERRASQQQESPPKKPSPPIPSRSRITSTYGLAPKLPLFVANPDHKHSGSGDS